MVSVSKVIGTLLLAGLTVLLAWRIYALVVINQAVGSVAGGNATITSGLITTDVLTIVFPLIGMLAVYGLFFRFFPKF